MEYPKTLRFTSTHGNLRIIFQPSSTREIDGQLVRLPGKELKFNRVNRGLGEVITSDPEIIKLALEDGKYYNSEYTCPEWEKMKYDEKLKLEANKNEEVAKPISKPGRKNKA